MPRSSSRASRSRTASPTNPESISTDHAEDGVGDGARSVLECSALRDESGDVAGDHRRVDACRHARELMWWTLDLVDDDDLLGRHRHAVGRVG